MGFCRHICIGDSQTTKDLLNMEDKQDAHIIVNLMQEGINGRTQMEW